MKQRRKRRTMPTENQLSPEEEERLIAVSLVPLIPVLLFTIVYYIPTISSSVEDVFRYTMLAVALYMFAGFGIYEVVSSFKVKRSLLFRVKRFLSRIVFAGTTVLCFYVIYSFLSVLLSPFLKIQYILSLSLLTFSFTLFALFQNSKFRKLVKKLTQEDWAA